jgi:outer membrane protein
MKNKIAKYLIAGLLLNGGYCMAQPANVRVLSLQECIDIALQRSTQVLVGNNNVTQAGALVLAAYGQYLPNLQAGAGYNYDGGNNFYSSGGVTVANEARSAYNYQLTSSLNIFTGYYNRSNLKYTKINKQIADLTLNRAKQQIELDVTQSYLQVVLDSRLVALDSSNLLTSEKREDQLTMQSQVGRVAKTDLYQQQAQTSNDKLTYINAKGRLLDDKVVLLQKLRIDSTDSYDFAEININDNADAGTYGNRDILIQEALKDRLDLQSARASVDAADWNIKRNRSTILPRVTLNAGVYNNGAYFNSLAVDGSQTPVSQSSIPYQLGNYTYGLVGINATWNIFDQFLTKSNVIVAKMQASDANISLQDTLIGVTSDIKQAYTDYTTAVQQMETVGAGLYAAQQAYEAVNAQYREGATDFITESNAQIVLLQAAQNKVQASVNMMLQKKVIDYYVGNSTYR